VTFITRKFLTGSERQKVGVGMVGTHVCRAAPEPLVPDRIFPAVLACMAYHFSHQSLPYLWTGYPSKNNKVVF